MNSAEFRYLIIFTIVLTNIIILVALDQHLDNIKVINVSLVTILATISSLFLSIIGNFFSDAIKKIGRQMYVQRNEAAITQYINHLGRLIEDATIKDEGEILVASQVIVSTRDEFKSSLLALNKLLNSEIDLLATMLLGSDAETKQIADCLKALNMKWSTKSSLMEFELRKLFAQLGLIEL